jgi:hypothetical protein
LSELTKNGTPGDYYWIGMVLQRKIEDGKPTGDLIGAGWIDGSEVNYGDPILASTQQPWGKGQPSNSQGVYGEVCVQLYLYDLSGPAFWNDAACEKTQSDRKFGYICQKPARART